MKHHIILLCAMLPLTGAALTRQNRVNQISQADSILAKYSAAMDDLVGNAQASGEATTKMPSPYMYRLLGPGTLYASALSQSFGQTMPLVASAANDGLPSLGQTQDTQLALNAAINEQLARAYVATPLLFQTTQDELAQAGTLRSDLAKPVEVPEVKLADKVEQEHICKQENMLSQPVFAIKIDIIGRIVPYLYNSKCA